MVNQQQVITQEGYDKLKRELDELVRVKRIEIAKRIEKAKELGDLSENAEYSEAKEAQAFNEGKIIELSNLLKNITVVKSKTSKDKISMGSKIKVQNLNTKKTKDLVIVSFNESDPLEGKISNESPLGLAFFGRKKDDVVVVNTPKGEIEYKILSVS